MEYAGEMVSGAMIYKPSFIEIGLAIQKMLKKGEVHRQQPDDFISLLLFFSK
jgi:hypothetical protein